MTTPLPPHDIQAEQSVLGAMLLSADAIDAVIDFLAPEDFYNPANGHICEAILRCYQEGRRVDAVTIADELKRTGLIDTIGGPAVLLDMQAATPAVSNAGRYGRIVEDHALLRRMAATGRQIAAMAADMPRDVRAALADAEALIYNIGNSKRAAGSLRPLSSLVPEQFKLMEERSRTDHTQTVGSPTGFEDLDEMLRGLMPGAFYVLGARPAMGKSSLAMDMGVNASQRGPVAVFSLEMRHGEMVDRLLASSAIVNGDSIKTGDLSEDDWSRLTLAADKLMGLPIEIDDDPMVTVDQIRSRARQMKSRHGGLALVIVDYLQLMRASSKVENRVREVSEISEGLKRLARELDCPILALAQLNRNLESRTDKRPVLSDLKDSGSLEQDADVVLFVYRDEVYNEESPDKGLAEVIVAKHRSGQIGTVRLAFRGQYTRFDNMSKTAYRVPMANSAGYDGGMPADEF